MRRIISRIICVILAAFLFSVTVSAASCPDGLVVYRQNFADVSTPCAAGLVNGTKNAETFSTTVSDGALSINNYAEERAHVILPIYNSSDNYTVRVTFALSEAKAANGYFGLMLTCKGDEPNNITSVILRANGECDAFGKLSAKLTDDMAKGERVTLTVPVSDGILNEIYVSCAGNSEKLIMDNVTDIVYGNMGFMARNASVRVYEIAVINGTDYARELGEFANTSTWTDEKPYGTPAASACSGYALNREGTFAAPTGDNIFPVAVVAVAAFAGVIIILKKRR